MHVLEAEVIDVDPHNLMFGKRQSLEIALANYRMGRQNCPEWQCGGFDNLIREAEEELAQLGDASPAPMETSTSHQHG